MDLDFRRALMSYPGNVLRSVKCSSCLRRQASSVLSHWIPAKNMPEWRCLRDYINSSPNVVETWVKPHCMAVLANFAIIIPHSRALSRVWHKYCSEISCPSPGQDNGTTVITVLNEIVWILSGTAVIPYICSFSSSGVRYDMTSRYRSAIGPTSHDFKPIQERRLASSNVPYDTALWVRYNCPLARILHKGGRIMMNIYCFYNQLQQHNQG